MIENAPPGRMRNTLIGVLIGVVFGLISLYAMFWSQFLAVFILMVGMVVGIVGEGVYYVYGGLALLQVVQGGMIGRRHLGGLGGLFRKLILRGFGLMILLFILGTVVSFFFLETAR